MGRTSNPKVAGSNPAGGATEKSIRSTSCLQSAKPRLAEAALGPWPRQVTDCHDRASETLPVFSDVGPHPTVLDRLLGQRKTGVRERRDEGRLRLHAAGSRDAGRLTRDTDNEVVGRNTDWRIRGTWNPLANLLMRSCVIAQEGAPCLADRPLGADALRAPRVVLGHHAATFKRWSALLVL